MIETTKAFLKLVSQLIQDSLAKDLPPVKVEQPIIFRRELSPASESEPRVFNKLKKVISCFKDASNRVGRVDRDLQEVIDAQVYIMEEMMNDRGKDHSLETLIQDFNVTMDQAMKAIFLSQDNQSSGLQSLNITSREKKMNYSKKVLSISLHPLQVKASKIWQKQMAAFKVAKGLDPNLKFLNNEDLQKVGLKILRTFKEALVSIKSNLEKALRTNE